MYSPRLVLYPNYFPAVRANSTALTCTTPAWKLDHDPDFLSLDETENELISLTVFTGLCATKVPFQFYSEPKVFGVSPLQGPRYGSFEVIVNLGYSLSGLTEDGMVRFPRKRIMGCLP